MWLSSNASVAKRGIISELPRALKQARRDRQAYSLVEGQWRSDDKEPHLCCTVPAASADPQSHCYEPSAKKVPIQMAKMITSPLLVDKSLNAANTCAAAEEMLEYTRADGKAMATQRPRALDHSSFMTLMDLMLHRDTDSAQVAACSALLHQSLANVPGSWQPLHFSCVMQLIHNIAAAPLLKLVAIAAALGLVHQAIRDAARLGIGPVMLLTDALPAAELYRQPLVAALGVFTSWGISSKALNQSTLNCSKTVLSSARGRACFAALQLVGSIGLILVEQGRLTSSRAAELLAAAH
jgi:hypothetical protein